MGRVNESGGGADAGTMVRPVSPTDGGDARSGDRLSGGRGDDDDHVPDGKATAGEACRRQARIIRALSVASALNCTSWFMMIPARPAMVALFESDPAFVGSTLAGMTSGASLFEFLLTPSLGALSDRVGRRKVLIGAAVVCAAARFVTFLTGDVSLRAVVLANWLDRCFSGSAFPLFLTTAFAAATDLYKESGDDSVINQLQAQVHSIVGAALIVAPAMGALVMARTGHPKHTALAASVISLAHAVYVWRSVEETAPLIVGGAYTRAVSANASKRETERGSGDPPSAAGKGGTKPPPENKDGKWNPFSFVDYFSISPTVAGLMVSYLLHNLPLEMHDMRMTLTRTVLKFTDGQTASMLTALGVGTLFGGMAAKRSMEAFGSSGHNIIASVSYITAQLCWMLATGPRAIYLSGLFFLLGGSSALPAKTALVTTILAARPDLQGGEIAGALANLSSVTKVVMPQVYARLFAKFGQRGPFLFAALAIAAGASTFALVAPHESGTTHSPNLKEPKSKTM